MTNHFFGKNKRIWKCCKVLAMRIFSKKNFFVFVLHHRIELELLITKNCFFALTNTFFWSKNTKYWKAVVFREKHVLSRNVQNFLLYSVFLLLKIIFSDSALKTEYKKILKSTLDPKTYWRWRFESRRVHYVYVDFVNLSGFRT